MTPFTRLFLLFGWIVSASSISRADVLVSLDAKDEPVENGKLLRMEFRELKRTGNESTVRVTFHSGGSVSSSMFFVRGGCAVAKSRGMTFFLDTASSEIDEHTTEYTLAFSNSLNDAAFKRPPKGDGPADEEVHVWDIGECRMLGFLQ